MMKSCEYYHAGVFFDFCLLDARYCSLDGCCRFENKKEEEKNTNKTNTVLKKGD